MTPAARERAALRVDRQVEIAAASSADDEELGL
jgi:hypothetical protein